MNQSPTALLQELGNIETPHARRRQIGELLEDVGDPRAGVASKNGVPDMVWLPVTGGTVTIKRVWEHETPDEEDRVTLVQNFKVEPFFIAKYLVTYGQYQAFVEAADGFNNLAWWADMPEAYQLQKLDEQHTKRLNNPRDNISWYQCVAFARWMNHRLQGHAYPHPPGQGALPVSAKAQIRLPAEWEWQWAAQNGAEERTYPWGAKNAGYANTAESGLKQAIAVGMYPHGAAACGALDMTGNIMEWCANDKQNIEIIDAGNNASKVLRGGDWAYGIEIATCARADDEEPSRLDILNGFRLVWG
jgi:formylglycine-generating enzyme required for sulfatase activity